MWSSGSSDNTNNNQDQRNKKNNCFSISSIYSSTCSSSSPSPFSNPKDMEEVWNDITLSSLPASHGLQDPHFNLQNFLARPFGHNPPNTNLPSSAAPYGSPPPLPATVLSLNSGQDFHFVEPQVIMPISNVGSFSTAVPYDGSVGMLGKKRFPDSNENAGDRRHKRMIKNRESAARSRARKQAYTNELKLEVASLMEENARLKKQQQQLCIAASAQVPQKHTLHRTSTAPF